MKERNLDWPKRTLEKTQNDKRHRQASMQSWIAKFDSEKVSYEDVIRSLQNTWGRLNVDEILTDLKVILDADYISTSAYPKHNVYEGKDSNPPNIKKAIFEYGSPVDDGWGGEYTPITELFSINLDSYGFHFTRLVGRAFVNKNIGIPTNEDRLKDLIDKFLSS